VIKIKEKKKLKSGSKQKVQKKLKKGITKTKNKKQVIKKGRKSAV